MPTTIPDSMPEDWLIDGAIARGREPDDLDLKHAMTEAYERGLDDLGIAGIMVVLKNLCVNAAAPLDQDTVDDLVSNAPGGIVRTRNHHLSAEPVTAGVDVTSPADQDGMA